MPAPLLAGGLAVAAAHKLAALGLGASILIGGTITADAATGGGLHLGVGQAAPPGHAVAAVAQSQRDHSGPDADDQGAPGTDDQHGTPSGAAGSESAHSNHGDDVRAVAHNAEAAAEGGYANHGGAVRVAARTNHGQDVAVLAHGDGISAGNPTATHGQVTAAEHRNCHAETHAGTDPEEIEVEDEEPAGDDE